MKIIEINDKFLFQIDFKIVEDNDNIIKCLFIFKNGKEELYPLSISEIYDEDKIYRVAKTLHHGGLFPFNYIEGFPVYQKYTIAEFTNLLKARITRELNKNIYSVLEYVLSEGELTDSDIREIADLLSPSNDVRNNILNILEDNRCGELDAFHNIYYRDGWRIKEIEYRDEQYYLDFYFETDFYKIETKEKI